MSDHGLNDTHSVACKLAWRISHGPRLGNVKVEEAIRRYGRPFTGIARPKEFRPRTIKRCFNNAGNLASAERGIYVEGFGMRHDWLFHHAWITVDGVHAIDVTLRDTGPGVSYFGIPFSPKVFSRWLCKAWSLDLPQCARHRYGRVASRYRSRPVNILRLPEAAAPRGAWSSSTSQATTRSMGQLLFSQLRDALIAARNRVAQGEHVEEQDPILGLCATAETPPSIGIP